MSSQDFPTKSTNRTGRTGEHTEQGEKAVEGSGQAICTQSLWENTGGSSSEGFVLGPWVGKEKGPIFPGSPFHAVSSSEAE